VSVCGLRAAALRLVTACRVSYELAVRPMSACCLKACFLTPCLCHHVFMHNLEHPSSDARSQLCKVLGKALEPRNGLT